MCSMPGKYLIFLSCNSGLLEDFVNKQESTRGESNREKDEDSGEDSEDEDQRKTAEHSNEMDVVQSVSQESLPEQRQKTRSRRERKKPSFLNDYV